MYWIFYKIVGVWFINRVFNNGSGGVLSDVYFRVGVLIGLSVLNIVILGSFYIL